MRTKTKTVDWFSCPVFTYLLIYSQNICNTFANTLEKELNQIQCLLCIVVIALFIQYVSKCWSFTTNESILRKMAGQNSQIIVTIIID